MVSTRDEINAAIQRLEPAATVFRELSDAEARVVIQAALKTFVGVNDRRWWWEAFSEKAVARKARDGFMLLTKLVPQPDELVWFIVEDTDLPFYPVYETTPAAVERIVGECFGFEYYLVAKDMCWLLCENHHETLIGIGEPVTTRLAQLVN